MNKILLVDADSTIPNLALMKISTYHKNMGDEVTLKQVNLPYYPNKKREIYYIPDGYNKVYCSVIFDNNINYVKAKPNQNVNFGGTGVSLDINLPDEISKLEPDYSLYNEREFSYGFITRGCIRKCYFCKVPKKEGNIRLENEPENIIKHTKVKFMDNNILAYSEHKRILQKLIDLKVKVQFNQGLDIRLVDEENSELLRKLKYIGEYYFAFDDIKYKNIIESKINLLYWRRDWQLKFFVYVHPDMELSATIERIEWLKEHKCLTYLMRDISCWESDNNHFYIDLAAYCNQVNIYKKMTFRDFMVERTNNKDRVEESINLYYKNGGKL